MRDSERAMSMAAAERAAAVPSKITMHLYKVNGEEVAQWLWVGKGLPNVVFWQVHGGQRFFSINPASVESDSVEYHECGAPVEIGKL